jgi:GGDEF domain-containing protein
MATVRIPVPGGVVTPTASFGCAALSECREPTNERLIDLADQRLLIAKRTGRNRVVARDD